MDEIREIVDLLLARVRVQLKAQQIDLEVTQDAKDHLVKLGFDADYGARPAKRTIQNQASRYGFFSGRFVSQALRVDPQAGIADIELIYDSGPRYALGPVSFEGDTPFDEDLLRRMVPFKAGAPYDSELIAELNQALQSFDPVEAVPVLAGLAQIGRAHV